jgi:DNA polymerase III delta prime subunit
MAKNELGMTNVIQIRTTQIPDILNIMRKTKQVVSFMGPPGCGKTASVQMFAKELADAAGKKFVENPSPDDWDNEENFCFSTVLTSQIEEIDTRGLPHITTKANGQAMTVYTMTELFPPKGKGVIFLDEFANGRTQVQNALQQILLEHKAGNMVISPDIQFVMASNRPQDNCGTFYVPAALRNRVAWFEVNRPKTEEWLKIMRKIGRPINPWIEGFVLAVGEKYVDNFNPKAEQYAYGTIRSVELASKAIDGINEPEVIGMLVGGFMGAAAGQDLKAFIALSAEIDLAKLLDNPIMIKKYTDRIGMIYSICVNLIKKGCEGDDKTREKIFQVLEQIGADEYAVFVINGFLREKGKNVAVNYVKNSPTGVKNIVKWSSLLSGGK